MNNSISSTTSTTTLSSGKVSSPPEDNDDHRLVTILCIVGGVILLAVVILLSYLYVRRRRKRQQPSVHLAENGRKKQPDSDYEVETGQLNPGLDISSSEIYKPHGKVSTAACIDESLTEFKNDEMDPMDENVIHNVSIKLLTNWSDIYTMIDTPEYMSMKQLVETSLESIYVSYDGFESATLLKFREGSVIADVQLRFCSRAVEPLSVLEKAIKNGKCGDLELDGKYFKILMPDLKTIDGFTRKETFQVPKRNDRESGYYGGSEEDDLNLHKASKSQSTKSTQSRDSMTSEVDSSYVSSTNISINSGAEDEGEGSLNIVHSRTKTGFLPRFSKSNKSKEETPLKQSSFTIGQLHKARFDFEPESAQELSLTKGEIVTIKAVNVGGWAKAINEKNQLGWIPQNFVVPFNVKKDKDSKIRDEAITLLDGLETTLDCELASTDDEDEDEDYSDSNEEELFITIFPFDPSEKNELRLEVGDLIDVLKTDETGWWKGHCLRTEEDGWFPSSYVKPFTPTSEKTVSLSDSEVMKRTDSLGDKPRIDGYSSDNGQTRTKAMKDDSKIQDDLVCNKEDTKEETKTEDKEKQETSDKKILESNVILRTKKGAQKERTTSLIIDTKSANMKHLSPAPLTPPPRLSAHRDHGTEKTFAEPPSKPVPPKPRQKHIEKEYHNLVASGKLGSQDSLKTVSTECLASLTRSPHKRGSGKRRNSEEITPSQFEGVIRRHNESKIHRARPKSFQESSFFYLAKRFPSIKPAFSLPSLIGDQVKLSPDDDRPFHDPIPRRAKSHSLIDTETPMVGLLDRNCSSLKDLTVSVDKSSPSSKLSPTYREGRSLKDSKQSPLASSSTSSLHNDNGQNIIHDKPLPPEPDLLTTLPPMMSHLLANKNLRASPLISQKPLVPPRGSSKNKVAMKLIEEQRSKQTSLHADHHYQPRGHVPYGRLRQQKHFSSFESINEESEQGNTPKDEAAKLPGEHDHRRCRSEPHDRILQNEMVHFSLPRQKTNDRSPSTSPSFQISSDMDPVHIQISNEDKELPLTNNSRASSMQSLASVESSVRSTASSKHEQQNLRRAIMDVHGQGENDLSFNIGAILYELRPKNKNGLCYGILDDSTQGWYPAESVEHKF